MPINGPVRVAIANDYQLVVSGLHAVLEPYREQIAVVELDASVPVVSNVDVVLYDTFGQVQGEAIDVAAILGKSGARLVVFSWNTTQDLVDQALASGASGYVVKSVEADDLVDALVRVHSGERVIRGEIDGPRETTGRVGRWPGDDEGLSPRESEVLALICQGLSNQEITERAFIAMNTVKTHIRSLYRKIRVTTRAQAVAWGLTHGFSPTPSREILDG